MWRRRVATKGLFIARKLNWPEQLDPVTRRVHWSRASASRLYYALIGCSETRTVSARLVLNTRIPMRPFTVDFANWSSVQFMGCEYALIGPVLLWVEFSNRDWAVCVCVCVCVQYPAEFTEMNAIRGRIKPNRGRFIREHIAAICTTITPRDVHLPIISRCQAILGSSLHRPVMCLFQEITDDYIFLLLYTQMNWFLTKLVHFRYSFVFYFACRNSLICIRVT